MLALLVLYRAGSHELVVQAAVAAKRDLEMTVPSSSVGIVKSDHDIKITAQRAGRITALMADEGDAVKKDRLIAQLDPAQALQNLNSARSAYDQAEAELEELKITDKPIEEEAGAAVREAKAAYSESDQNFKRIEQLRQKGIVSQAELDSAMGQRDMKKAAYDSAVAAKEKASANSSKIKAQEAAVREAGAALQIARLEYGYSFIKAPASGVISERPVKVGQFVQQGSLIAGLTDMKSLYIEAAMDEADAGNVALGDEAVLKMDAFPGLAFRGSVYVISPLVQGKQYEAKTFQVRIRLVPEQSTKTELSAATPAALRLVKPGMSADVEIIAKRLKGALAVPAQSIFEGEGGGHFVYVIKDGRARLREVTIGMQGTDYTQILSGLNEGDQVVSTLDVTGLADGARVKVKNLKNASH